MDELFTPVSTTYLRPRAKNDDLQLVEAKPATKTSQVAPPSRISSADDALSTLKSQPDYDSLAATLRFIVVAADDFNLHTPSPKSAAILHTLVSEIVPNYWTLLLEGSSQDEGSKDTARPRDAGRLLQSLRSVAGVNALVGQIKAHIQESKLTAKDLRRPDIELNLRTYLDILSALLDGHDSIRSLWIASTKALTEPASQKVQAQSLVSLITNGRIISITAEACEIIGKGESPEGARWLSDGIQFTRWVGHNVASWARRSPEGGELQSCFDVFHRALSLGYPETLVRVAADELLLAKDVERWAFARTCLHQSQASKKVMQLLLQYLSGRFLNGLTVDNTTPNASVSAVAGIIADVVQNDQIRRNHLINWCCNPSGAGLGDRVGIRRAVVAVLADDRDSITTVLEKSMAQFGDQLYIKHTAILQQEAHAQVLLLSAASVAKVSPIKLTMLLRSGTYLTAISNRIASTHARARFLGMAVGEALSTLVDNQTKKLDFHMEETDTNDAQWLKALSRVSDPVGPAEPLLSNPAAPAQPTQPSLSSHRQKSKPKAKPYAKKPKHAVSEPAPKAIIEEVDSSDEEDEKFIPKAKLSDDEDSDEDPTLVQRNKPKAPVYIRDLITFLRDSESYDKQKLGVQTAPVLIRRKGNYGTEVSSHAEELARLLVALQDKFDIENFGDLRLQGMMALVVAQPKSMAPWFARTFFEGDYSLAQRSSVLITLGLSARELAGFDTSEYESKSSFPSKRLPEKIEQLYIDQVSTGSLESSSQLKALPYNALDNITQSLTSSFLGPMAAQAADANTGPDALKLETFTARYKSKSKAKPRVRAIPNTTAANLATYFFSPLTAHFQFALRSSKPVVLNPAMLALYLQTLGIIVNAAGPSTLSLPQLTSELWDLLLRVRAHVLGDVGATKSWMVAMAVLLEVNADNMRRLCEEHGREVVETREWVSGVFERTRGDDSGGEENDAKMLAAGVLIKLGEAIEKYQALLMGDLIGYN